MQIVTNGKEERSPTIVLVSPVSLQQQTDDDDDEDENSDDHHHDDEPCGLEHLIPITVQT